MHIPPCFKYRITFILVVWRACCVTTAATPAGPVLLDRRFFLLFTTGEVHDEDSFVIGFRLLRGCWLIVKSVERLNRHRQGRENSSRSWWLFFLAKRGSSWWIQMMQNKEYLGSVDDFWAL